MRLTERIRDSAILKSVLTLTTGTSIAQAIAILVAPVLTRLYSPSDIGSVAAAVAVVSVIGIISAGRYDQAIVVSNDDSDATTLAFIGLLLAIAVGLLVSATFVISGERVATLLGIDEIPQGWIYTIGLLVTLVGCEQVLTQLSIRHRKYRSVAISAVAQQVGANTPKIAGGLCGGGVGWLFLGTVAGYLARPLSLLSTHWKRFFAVRGRIRPRELVRVAHQFKKFPLVSSWSAVLNSVSIQMPVLLFTALFSPAVSGSYALGHRILQLPMTFVGRNVGHVFLERASRLREDPAALSSLAERLFRQLLLAGSAVLSFVTFYGSYIFPFVLGPDWVDAGRYGQWLSVWLVFQLSSSPLSAIYFVMNRHGELLFFQAMLASGRVLTIIVASAIGSSALLTIQLYSIVSLVLYVVLSLRVLLLARVRLRSILKTMGLIAAPIYAAQALIWIILNRLGLL